MEVMTTRQVARLIGEGFPEHRLHYAIRIGALPSPSMLGHSLVWTHGLRRHRIASICT
jgi:hypothetical protein